MKSFLKEKEEEFKKALFSKEIVDDLDFLNLKIRDEEGNFIGVMEIVSYFFDGTILPNEAMVSDGFISFLEEWQWYMNQYYFYHRKENEEEISMKIQYGNVDFAEMILIDSVYFGDDINAFFNSVNLVGDALTQSLALVPHNPNIFEKLKSGDSKIKKFVIDFYANAELQRILPYQKKLKKLKPEVYNYILKNCEVLSVEEMEESIQMEKE